MKTLGIKYMILPFLLLLAGFGCEQSGEGINKNCIVGIIPQDTVYKVYIPECYPNSFWIEVLNNDALGMDISVDHIYPTHIYIPPRKYKNVVEVPLPLHLLYNSRRDTLLGKKIYFTYRPAEQSEINAIRVNACEEIYQLRNPPMVVITSFSFSECPQSSY